MKQLWPVAVAVALFGGLGLAEAFRPRPTAADAAAVQAALDALPLSVGAWAGTPEAFSDRVKQQAEAVAAVSRLYRRADPPAEVRVVVLAGPPGAMGAHDPTVCLAGAGFTAAGAVGRRPCGVDALWTGRYDTAGDGPQTVQVSWGWSAGGGWAASDDPRGEFAGAATVYKLYVSRGLPAGGGRGQPDPTDEFLSAFLPATRLTPAGTTPAAP